MGTMEENTDITSLFDKLKKGDRFALARAITLIESEREDHKATAADLIELCLPHSGKSRRVGISGSPGAGKSTFIEALGMELINSGRKVAVLSIDPTSKVSKGSILGDKTRMDELSRHESAFVRPTAAGDFQGGVGGRTREAILLCEAAGYDDILIETVGVGQSETLVSEMVDCFTLVLIPGAGDDLQSIKRGIVELADIFVINKADGNNLKAARITKASYHQTMGLLGQKESGWPGKTVLISALHKEGIGDFVTLLREYFSFIRESAYLERRRTLQNFTWFETAGQNTLKNALFQHPDINNNYKTLRKAVQEGKLSVSKAIHEFELCLKEKL